ncbi:hypothetical protein RFI_15172 [Reticulomyxa filosa]|uniref:FUN14 family protein n=1 Tax=Reticulomyxa filosa TaxID=46433 RepID=X6N7L1_RETFI|nr:hypothetical protein RFI_15172 [Reticulomyxa filosa]|eukprot:ETO22031.1 hypothetical protein RFI_15172 [Reticulomyxa filosa]
MPAVGKGAQHVKRKNRNVSVFGEKYECCLAGVKKGSFPKRRSTSKKKLEFIKIIFGEMKRQQGGEPQAPMALQYANTNNTVYTRYEPGHAGYRPGDTEESEYDQADYVRSNVNVNVNFERSQAPSEANPVNDKKLSDVLTVAIANEDVQKWLSPYAQLFTIGGGVGFVSGLAVKKMGHTLVKYGIGTALTIQLLSYSGYIQFNWKKVQNDVDTFGERLHGTQAIQFIATNIGPILAGFGLDEKLFISKKKKRIKLCLTCLLSSKI